MTAIFKRELGAYFKTPVGWIFLAVYFVFSGYFFWYMISYNTTNSAFIFDRMFTFSMFLVPVLTMRLMSDEKRLKTDQLLLTSPVSVTGVVMGKFLAAVSVYSVAVCINAVYMLVMSVFTTPDWTSFFGNFVGALLLGAAFTAAGVFVSSLTESQLISAVGTFAVLLMLYLLDSFKGTDTESLLYRVIDGISLNSHYESFTRGLVDYSDAVFFISLAAVFIFLTVRLIERKRWN